MFSCCKEFESIFDRSQSCDQSIEPIIPFKMAANVQSMCQYWKNFDLQDLQVMLHFNFDVGMGWSEMKTIGPKC